MFLLTRDMGGGRPEESQALEVVYQNDNQRYKISERVSYPTYDPKSVSDDKKEIVKNLYLSNIAEEFVAMRVDLEIPMVISILKELDVFRGQIEYEGD
jgi:hypothetical protein